MPTKQQAFIEPLGSVKFPSLQRLHKNDDPKHEEILQPPLLMILLYLPHCKQHYIIKIIQCSLMSTELRC